MTRSDLGAALVTYQSILAYDGTEFAGFQRQRGRRTVQGEVEKTLRRLGWQEQAIRAAGRTDTGVHATGQVIAYSLAWDREADRLTQALNAMLPSDAAVVRTDEVPAGFHPRYAAHWRRYRYRVIVAPERQPLGERYAWRVWPGPELAAMARAGAMLLGEHDFGAFGQPPRRESHTRRTVRRADWIQNDEGASFVIEGDAFLYRMVRRLTAALVAVGQGRIAPEAIADSLANPRLRWQGRLAPAHGLCLEAVEFDENQADG
ncbi:MAG TPA: tRNA pseudouridine(38-40) synthase TruA [Anaerolineales bacterium]|nr:tRNA pseudouridine(38-40) synthase TruA [Anaerolineales bacterium]